jgi:hypothetical protein
MYGRHTTKVIYHRAAARPLGTPPVEERHGLADSVTGLMDLAAVFLVSIFSASSSSAAPGI